MIAATHPQQNTRVMREFVGQPVDQSRTRQSDSEKSADHARFGQRAPDFVQTTFRHGKIDMQEPEDAATRDVRAGIHLRGPVRPRFHNLGASFFHRFGRSIGASAVGHDNFRVRSVNAEMLQKTCDQRCFI